MKLKRHTLPLVLTAARETLHEDQAARVEALNGGTFQPH
jgi:hypothetical protein